MKENKYNKDYKYKSYNVYRYDEDVDEVEKDEMGCGGILFTILCACVIMCCMMFYH